jgi:hypothetical protein
MLIHGDELGLPADADTIVRLAEEAHAAYPSEGTYFALAEALSFRLLLEAARRDPTFAQIHARAKRSVYPVMILAAALADDTKRVESVLTNQDFQRLLQIVLEYDQKFSERPNPWSWILLRLVNPDKAAGVAERILADRVGQLRRAIKLRVSPFDASEALESYWRQQIAGKEADGRTILKRLSEHGVPLPVEIR